MIGVIAFFSKGGDLHHFRTFLCSQILDGNFQNSELFSYRHGVRENLQQLVGMSAGREIVIFDFFTQKKVTDTSAHNIGHMAGII